MGVMFVCLFVCLNSSPAAVTITSDRAANLYLCMLSTYGF
jgi:hypothetical protein